MKPDVPSLVAWMSTVPLASAVTRPSAVMVAIAGLLITYRVPVAAAVTLRAVPSA